MDTLSNERIKVKNVILGCSCRAQCSGCGDKMECLAFRVRGHFRIMWSQGELCGHIRQDFSLQREVLAQLSLNNSQVMSIIISLFHFQDIFGCLSLPELLVQVSPLSLMTQPPPPSKHP